MLKVSKINVYYGNVQALRDVSIEVHKGEIVTLIGANGAGKTTFLMTISGIIKPKFGSIQFLGSRIDVLKPHRIVELGISHVSQERNLFLEMTVGDNLELGAYQLPKEEDIGERLEEIYSYFEILRGRKNQKVGSLSGGEQQILAIGRALMLNPRLILLDEPSEGLAPVVVNQLAEIIKKLREEKGLTTLIVEQNCALALELADRGYLLETGAVVMSGESSELRGNELVKKAYLGM